MIVTDGGRFGGYGLYLLKGKPVFTYNLLALERARWEGDEPLAPGKHTLEFDFKYDGPGMAKGGSGVLKVDGKEVATKTLPHTIPAILTIDETLDIGSDTRTPVDDADYQVPFPFTGTIDKVGLQARAVATDAGGPQGRAGHEGQREQIEGWQRNGGTHAMRPALGGRTPCARRGCWRA